MADKGHYLFDKETKLVEMPCQNCKKPVLVQEDFHGCVFCSGCMMGTDGYYSTESEEEN